MPLFAHLSWFWHSPKGNLPTPLWTEKTELREFCSIIVAVPAGN